MGDDHSGIKLVPLSMNGIRIPAGRLFSLQYTVDTIQKTGNKVHKGSVIPLSAVDGFWFLRLATLSVSPENRPPTFSSHFKQQVAHGVYSSGTTQLQ